MHTTDKLRLQCCYVDRCSLDLVRSFHDTIGKCHSHLDTWSSDIQQHNMDRHAHYDNHHTGLQPGITATFQFFAQFIKLSYQSTYANRQTTTPAVSQLLQTWTDIPWRTNSSNDGLNEMLYSKIFVITLNKFFTHEAIYQPLLNQTKRAQFSCTNILRNPLLLNTVYSHHQSNYCGILDDKADIHRVELCKH